MPPTGYRTISFTVSDDQHEAITQAAAASFLTVSAYCRQNALQTAERIKREVMQEERATDD